MGTFIRTSVMETDQGKITTSVASGEVVKIEQLDAQGTTETVSVPFGKFNEFVDDLLLIRRDIKKLEAK